MKQLIFILIFLAGLLSVEGIYILFKDIQRRRAEKLRRRIVSSIREETRRPHIWRERQFSQIALINNLLSYFKFAFIIERLLSQADIKTKVDRFIMIILSFLVLFGMMTYIIFGHNILISIPGALIGALIPIGYLIYKKKKRLEQFVERFPEALDFMVRSLRVGYALPHTFELIAKEFPEPLGTEFTKVYEEYNLGIPFEDALKRMEERLNILDVKFFVTSLLIQKEVGGNLSEILENLGYTIRERDELRRQAKVLTAEGRTSGWIMGTLPIVMGGIIFLLNPDYIKILFTHPIGKILLGSAIMMELLGAIVIKKIVTIKV